MARVPQPTASTHNPGAPMPLPLGDPDFMLSLARGLQTIRAFGTGRSQLTVAEVARFAEVSRAAARRCLHTLTVLGYARSVNGRYELTPAILSIGQAFLTSMSVAQVAQPVLERVSDELHESSSVAVLDGDEIVYVARAAVRRILSVSLAVGSRLPAACTSMGRVLLAAADSETRARFLKRVKLTRYTEHTITDRRALAAELHSVHARGFAIVDQELELGLRACAVPIVGADGTVVAALNVGAHAGRTDAARLKREFIPVMRRAAGEIGSGLGARRGSRRDGPDRVDGRSHRTRRQRLPSRPRRPVARRSPSGRFDAPRTDVPRA